MTDEPPIVAVDIWSDVMCPWCAIGYTQFAKARKELEGEIEVEVRWMPFELNPDLPPEGKSQAEHLAEVYDRSPEEIAEMRARLHEVAERAGFSLDYDDSTNPGAVPPEPMMWNTFEAHKLLRWALADQNPDAQTALSLALFRTHFQQRRNVGSREVLLDIAADLGFDRAKAKAALEDEALSIAVRVEEQRALQNDIRSVPSFVINGRYLIPGAQEPEVYRETLRRVAELAKEPG
jgi:predicted DsbA family dithiol-disulfide isomerase